jgi:hypothetical protein
VISPCATVQPEPLLSARRTPRFFDAKQWKSKYTVLYSPQITEIPLVCRFHPASTAVRIQREVTMESPTLTGPILYLLFAWGAITAVFIGLLIWRSLLCSHEDDQIFLDAAQEHMAKEQRELVAKISSLTRPIQTSGIAAGALLLVIVGMWLYEGLKSF